MRLNRVMCKMDDECISRDISEYEDIFNQIIKKQMVTPKKIIIKDLELADEEIARLRKENNGLKMKIDTLELCIKNKDELLEEYRKKIDKLRTDNIYEE